MMGVFHLHETRLSIRKKIQIYQANKKENNCVLKYLIKYINKLSYIYRFKIIKHINNK